MYHSLGGAYNVPMIVHTIGPETFVCIDENSETNP